MILNGEESYYLAGKELTSLFRRITWKNYSGFYCLNWLNFFRTKNKLELLKKVCGNKDFCNIVMSSEDTKILGFNKNQKPEKVPFIIYADLECLIRKTDCCKTNLRKPSTTKVDDHIPSNFSMFTISSVKSIENKHMYTEIEIAWWKTKSLGEHEIKIINFKIKKWN